MQFVERPEFAEWRVRVKRNGNYLWLCQDLEEQEVQWCEEMFDHLYEFCAMNGHLAAFEEVFPS